jgi:hypothetical protein
MSEMLDREAAMADELAKLNETVLALSDDLTKKNLFIENQKTSQAAPVQYPATQKSPMQSPLNFRSPMGSQLKNRFNGSVNTETDDIGDYDLWGSKGMLSDMDNSGYLNLPETDQLNQILPTSTLSRNTKNLAADEKPMSHRQQMASGISGTLRLDDDNCNVKAVRDVAD